MICTSGSKDKVPVTKVRTVTADINSDVCISLVPMTNRKNCNALATMLPVKNRLGIEKILHDDKRTWNAA